MSLIKAATVLRDASGGQLTRPRCMASATLIPESVALGAEAVDKFMGKGSQAALSKRIGGRPKGSCGQLRLPLAILVQSVESCNIRTGARVR